MAKNKVFVGSLSWDTDDSGLKDHFSPCGEIVEAKVITDHYTGRSRGFGFVTFESPDGATNALELDGQPLDGRELRIDYAHDTGRSGGSSRSSSGGGHRGDHRDDRSNDRRW